VETLRWIQNTTYQITFLLESFLHGYTASTGATWQAVSAALGTIISDTVISAFVWVLAACSSAAWRARVFAAFCARVRVSGGASSSLVSDNSWSGMRVYGALDESKGWGDEGEKRGPTHFRWARQKLQIFLVIDHSPPRLKL
jgi:hypothetical protein